MTYSKINVNRKMYLLKNEALLCYWELEPATIAISSALGCIEGKAAMISSISVSIIGLILGDKLATKKSERAILKENLMEEH